MRQRRSKNIIINQKTGKAILVSPKIDINSPNIVSGPSGANTFTEPAANPSADSQPLGAEPEAASRHIGVGGPLCAIVIVFVVAASIIWLNGTMWRESEPLELAIWLGSAAAGGLTGYFKGKRLAETVGISIAAATVVSWVLVVIVDLVTDGFSLIWVFVDLGLGLLIALAYSTLPAAICGVIAYAVQENTGE